MVKALLKFFGLFVTVPFFELAGAGLIIAGVWVLTSYGWAFIAGGVLALVKSFDLALDRKAA